MFRSVWMLSAAAVLGACATEPPCSSIELQDRDKAWAAAAFAKDLDELMSFYDGRATQLPPGGAAIEGKGALTELFRQLFVDPEYSLTWSVAEAYVSKACDLGYTLGDWIIVSRSAAGDLTESEGKYLGVWVKNELSDWVVLEDIFNRGGLRVLNGEPR